ncbi:unnamed protein product [Prunus brigantina]
MHQKVGCIEVLKDVETNSLRYKCIVAFILLSVIIIAGTIFLATVEKLDLVDAFYCVCSTITTLGYGDKSFSTRAGRVFAIFWILTSTICLALFLLYVAELNAQNRQRALVKWVLSRRMKNVDLEAADLDGDGVVGYVDCVFFFCSKLFPYYGLISEFKFADGFITNFPFSFLSFLFPRAAEFIIYMLKEMGKISQKDIRLVMEEFDDLDVDKSGILSTSDIMLAQPPQEEK